MRIVIVSIASAGISLKNLCEDAAIVQHGRLMVPLIY